MRQFENAYTASHWHKNKMKNVKVKMKKYSDSNSIPVKHIQLSGILTFDF